MLSKVLFIGDPHLKISNFDISKKFLLWVEEVVQKTKPNFIVNLGDTFHNHAVIRSEVMSEFMAHVYRVTQDYEYIYLLGNHDMYKPDDASYHALLPYKGKIKNFTVVDQVSDINGITFVPYMHNWLDFPRNPGQKIVVAHQTFIGADYGYYRPDVGVDADKIDAEIIISGHVHKRQSFGKVHYPGTPFAQGLDDINQVKGLVILDTSTYEMTFIESPFPMYRGLKLTIDKDCTIDDVHSILEDSLNSEDHWVVELTGPKAEIVAYTDSKRWHKIVSKASVRLKPEYNDKSKISNKSIKSVTMQDIVFEYVDNIYNGSLDKNLIKERVVQVLNNTD